jgi:hypothetical protein
MSAVHCEHLELVLSRPTHIAGNARRFSVPRSTEGIFECGQPGFTDRIRVDCAYGNPAFVSGVALDWRKQIPGDRDKEHRADDPIENGA